MKKAFLMMTVLFLSACNSNPSFTAARWTGHGEAPLPPAGFQLQTPPLTAGTKELIFQRQKIEDVEIDGSYYKKISQQGDVEFLDYRWMSKIPLSVRRDLLLMRAQKHFVLSHFLKEHDSIANLKLVDGPEMILQTDPSTQVLWRLVFERQDGTLQSFFLNHDLDIVSQRQIGAEFIDAMANLFPKGPLKSDLQEVVLKGLLSPHDLSSATVKISTEADEMASPDAHNELNYQTNDLRFSQVQVFFYVTQALNWMENALSFHLPFTLEAETQMGYPDKTNTAFYFQHKIRLGEGDGDVFDHIPMDPSIVTHESMHALIDAVAGLRYDGEGGSLNEGYADFFTTVVLNNPRLGEASYKKASFKRTVDNDLKLQDKNGGLYHDSGIISGLLWSLRKDLTPDDALNFAWQTLLHLNPGSDFNGFKQELLTVMEKESPDSQKKIHDELKTRGWIE